MPSPKLPREEFRRRYLAQFVDPAFDRIRPQLDSAADIAWQAYSDGRKAPLTRKAGDDFHDPSYDLSVDWLEARAAIDAAQAQHDATARPRILRINGSPRSEHTCPGEMSKTWRLVQIARQAVEQSGDCDVDILDLSRVTSEYGRHIHPCRHASRRRPRSAIGRARAIPIIRSARLTTG